MALSRAFTWSLLGLLSALLIGCEPAAVSSGPREKTAGDSVVVEVNSKAPAFAAQTLEGRTVRLADYVGKHVIMLEFWSVFCASCIQEMPRIEELYGRYGPDGLAVLSINTDVFSSARVASVLEKAGIHPPYPVVRDPRQEIVGAYNVELLPVTVLIDRQGWIRMYQEGYRPGDEKRFEAKIRTLLGRGSDEDVTLAPRGGVTVFAPAGTALASTGTRVTGLRARAIDGGSVPVEEGRPRLLFFWSLYCKPCRDDYPAVAGLAAKYRTKGLVAYAVNVDSPELAPRVEKFANQRPEMLCLLDESGEGEGIAKAVGVRATPAIVLLDATGTVVHSVSGSADVRGLEEQLLKLVERESF